MYKAHLYVTLVYFKVVNTLTLKLNFNRGF